MVSVGALVLALSACSSAESSEKGTLLEKVNLGENWYGPKLSLDDLKGRVVLIEFWGQH
jgi:hypothetical protein